MDRLKIYERWLGTLRQHPGRKREYQSASWKNDHREPHRNLFRQHSEHPQFIAAHFGWLGHDLSSLGKLLDECLAERIRRNSRHHCRAGETSQDGQGISSSNTRYRIPFSGRGNSWSCLRKYKTYFRVLETAENIFLITKKVSCLRADMYGLALPMKCCEKSIYYKKPLRIIQRSERSSSPNRKWRSII